MKVLLLCRYDRSGASSRLRCLQYIPYLSSQGIKIEVLSLFNDEYLKNLYKTGKKNIVNVLHCYAKRARILLKLKKFDLIWVEYELFPWLPDLFEKLIRIVDIPYIVDYDDAIFHRYNLNSYKIARFLLKNKIENIMRRANVVIAGNNYIANHAIAAGANRVEIIPTVIDLNRYKICERSYSEDFVIGWIGSPKTTIYLELIKPVINRIKKTSNIYLSLVGSGRIHFKNIKVKYHSWSEESEVHLINMFDIGIMPLLDSPWEKGKCGYKLIQYMACGKPVVASSVGTNKAIVENGINGFLTKTVEEWENAITILRYNPDLRREMGEAGRKKVIDHYCLQVTGPKLLSIFKSIRN